MPGISIAMLPLADHGWGGFVVLFFALLIGHSVADFALQNEFIATAKNRNANIDRFFGGNAAPKNVWIYVLSAHCLIHAGAVWLITGSIIFAALEFVLHALIDYAKSANCTNFQSDQLLHIACKLVYAILIAIGFSWIYWMP